MTQVDKARIVEALDQTWTSIDQVCSSLTVEDWSLPTDCPGWDVQDQVAHMIGTESFLLGRPAPNVGVEGLDYLRNPIGRSNEGWVQERRSRSPQAVLEEFRAVTTERRVVLAAMTQGDFDKESPTPSGDDTYGRFMQIRVMDCWMHEQDIRSAVSRPGHEDGLAVEVALDEVIEAIGYIVGKRGAAPSGSSVRLLLSGPSGRIVDVDVTDRARLSRGPLAQPTTTVTVPVTTFMRLAGGRADAEPLVRSGRVRIDGDTNLGYQIATNLAYMI